MSSENNDLIIKNFEDIGPLKEISCETISGKVFRFENCKNNNLISEDSLTRTLSVLKLAITKDDCHSLSDSHLTVPASSMLFDQSDLNSDNCLHRLEILCFPEYLKRYFSG